jgi:hypothetical protein
MFVRAWGKSRCFDDLRRITGLSDTQLWVRARKLRAAGVVLPRFGPRRKLGVIDPEGLSAMLIEERARLAPILGEVDRC